MLILQKRVYRLKTHIYRNNGHGQILMSTSATIFVFLCMSFLKMATDVYSESYTLMIRIYARIIKATG